MSKTLCALSLLILASLIPIPVLSQEQDNQQQEEGDVEFRSEFSATFTLKDGFDSSQFPFVSEFSWTQEVRGPSVWEATGMAEVDDGDLKVREMSLTWDPGQIEFSGGYSRGDLLTGFHSSGTNLPSFYESRVDDFLKDNNYRDSHRYIQMALKVSDDDKSLLGFYFPELQYSPQMVFTTEIPWGEDRELGLWGSWYPSYSQAQNLLLNAGFMGAFIKSYQGLIQFDFYGLLMSDRPDISLLLATETAPEVSSYQGLGGSIGLGLGEENQEFFLGLSGSMVTGPQTEWDLRGTLRWKIDEFATLRGELGGELDAESELVVPIFGLQIQVDLD